MSRLVVMHPSSRCTCLCSSFWHRFTGSRRGADRLRAFEAVPKRLPHCGGAGPHLLVEGIAHRLAGVGGSLVGGFILRRARFAFVVVTSIPVSICHCVSPLTHGLKGNGGGCMDRWVVHRTTRSVGRDGALVAEAALETVWGWVLSMRACRSCGGSCVSSAMLAMLAPPSGDST